MSRRRRLRALLVALLLLAAAAISPGPAAGSDGYSLSGLSDLEGDGWHPYPWFPVVWDPDPTYSASYITYALYTVPGVQPLPAYGGTRAGISSGAFLGVPPIPGRYLLEVFNVEPSPTGGPAVSGPPRFLVLSFDDIRPGPVSVTAPGWAAAGADVSIHVSPPTGAAPISGIQGYAVSIDRAAGASPCAAADRCTAGEVDLQQGAGDGTIEIPAPPEGISYVHAVAVSGSGLDSAATATVALGVDGTPPQVRLEGVPSGWSDGPVRVTATATDRLSGMAAGGPAGPITAIGVDGEPPSLVPGPVASATVAGQGTHKVVSWGRDAVGNAGDGSLSFSPPSAATVRIDQTDPTVRFLAGDPTDPERLEAIVADPLSGPDPVRGSIAVRRVGSGGSFEPLPTEVEPGRLVARWSSDDYPHGAYEFRAVGFDAAGNSATNLDGAGAPLVLHDPVKREAHVAFGFGAATLVFPRCARADGSRRCHRAVVRSFARRPATRAVPCCHGAVVGGRLVDSEGKPLPGQKVDVVETFPGGARHRNRRTTLTTDGDGDFKARLAPGPSREVSAEFPGTRRLTRASGRLLRLRIRAAVHLHVSTSRVRVGGAPVVFRGRVVHPEARIPARGLSVELEFRLPGMPWTQFRTVQSDAAGRFRYPYSFSDDDSAGVRFLFRAYLPATGGWPFAPATSRPLAVTG